MIWMVVLLLVVQAAIAAAALWAMNRVERWCGGLTPPPCGGVLRLHSLAAPDRGDQTWAPPYSQGDPMERFPMGIPWTALSRDAGPPGLDGPEGGNAWMAGRSVATPGLPGAFILAARRDPLAAYRRAFESDGPLGEGPTEEVAGANEPTATGPTDVSDTLARSRLEFARWLVQHGRVSEEL